MDEPEWESKALDLAALHASRQQASMSNIRLCLIEVDRLLRAAPTPIQERYKDISEEELRYLTERVLRRGLDDGQEWSTELDLVRAAAAQARSLDTFLYENSQVRRPPDDIETDHLCTASLVHAIPRPLAQPPDDPKDTGTLTYRRRGLVRHRLIPVVTNGGYKIRLKWYRDLSLSFRIREAAVVAGVFQDFGIARDDSRRPKFAAASSSCPDEDSTINAWVEAAYGPGVVAAVLPELTMPPERRRKLSSALLRTSASRPPGTGPAFVAAGSWHEVEGGKVRNRMHVLSRSGQARFHHDKSLPMESKELGVEELEPSWEIPVLVGEDALIAFAICRDFCEAQISTVYRELDVDIVMVPSLGDKKTFRSHRDEAVALWKDPGTRTFMVQQVVAEHVSRIGHAVAIGPNDDPSEVTVAAAKIDGVAASYPLSFKRV